MEDVGLAPQVARVRKKRRKKPQLRSFKPTTAMLRFLRVELEFLAKRRPYTQKQIAEAAAVSEGQASRWHDVEGFDDWTAREMRHVAVRLFERGAVAAGHRVIMTGDPRELEIFGRVMGLLESTNEKSRPSDSPIHNVINLLCPRPELPQGAIPPIALAVRLPPPNLPPSIDVPKPSQLHARR